MNSQIILTGPILIASLSSLLTFAHLWQIKEWRIDRLREHMKETHWFRLLLDVYRPFRYPVWTKKATVLVCTSLALTGAFSFELLAFRSSTIIFIPLLQPLFLLLSWTIWRPVDYVLKQHILNQAKHIRAQHPDLTVIGITGSVGKTTTKELLKHILADKNPIATPEYVNTELGIAQWLIQNAEMKNSKLLIVELGAYRKGEIKTLCSIVQPTIGVITWIGRQHLGLFGSQKNIADAKGELFEALPENGHAFINEESPFAHEVVQRATCPVTIVDRTADDLLAGHPSRRRSRLGRAQTDGRAATDSSCDGWIRGRGLENPRYNTRLAFAVARHLGMSREEIAAKLKTFTPSPHTFSVRTETGVTVLDDTHNASPESFHSAIAWAHSRGESSKILLTPGIIELGKESDTIHEELGKHAKGLFDRVIFLNVRRAASFERGYEKPIEVFSKTTEHIPPRSLLTCVGRTPPHVIHRLLPHS